VRALGLVVAVAGLLAVGATFMGSRSRGEVGRWRNDAPAAAPDALAARGSPRPAGDAGREGGGVADGRARVDVPFLLRPAAQVPETAPPGWTLKEFAGQADVLLQRVDGRVTVRLRSDGSSFALYRDVLVDPNDMPILSWTWKALRLPAGGDVRVAALDDQAAQIYVIFPRWPSPLINSDVIGYIWDTTAPVGARLTSPRAENVKLIVVESGSENLGRWLRYERNVLDDYVTLFGKRPPRVGKVAVMIDSNDTRSGAEAMWTDLAFQRAP
jgi:hypothetical protein